ncbi:MAG: hypothetical protein Q9166_002733 [cf. Caloplaca sp. 2 TL-2023]
MAARPMTPPPLQGPTAKEKKYDRQLRLWAASGQQALEDAHVLLLNDGPGVVGVETLKNLILPGIGSYTIVDAQVVAEEDLGINFYLTDDSLGKSRADETCKYLTELNPDVHGHPIQKSIEDFLADTNILDSYSLILFIASRKQNRQYLTKVSRYCSMRAVPLFYIHSLGLFSHFSVQLPDAFPIVDTHPDPASTQDLRLLDPWPELVTFMKTKTKNLDGLSDHEHGHVPYLLLLLRFLGDWRISHNGELPSGYREKKEFKSFVEAKARTNNAEGGEENFDEAAAAVLKSLNRPSLPSGLRQVFDEPECREPQKDSANFWLVASAIQKFHEAQGSLPLPGALPDMKAQSKDYIQLQTIYRTKARQDVDGVTKHVRTIEEALGRQAPVDSKEIEAFCKGASFVKLIKGQVLVTKPVYDSKARKHPDYKILLKGERSLIRMLDFLKDEDSLLPVYIAFWAYDILVKPYVGLRDFGEAPGAKDDNGLEMKEHEVTLDRLRDFTKEIIYSIAAATEPTSNVEGLLNETLPRVEPILEEFIRADGAELHNISALTGGMVAQEVIKVITKQYIPIDNTCVFDGIASKSAVFHI